MKIIDGLKTLYTDFPRQFGYFKNIEDKSSFRRIDVYDFNSLLKLINKYNSHTRCYCTIYNYHSKYKISEINLRLVPFDLDSEQCYEDMIKLHDFSANHNFKHCIVFSGRGFHIYVFTHNYESLNNKKVALMNAQNWFAEKTGANADKSIRGDVARVLAIPGTYNIKRMRYVRFVSSEELDKGFDFIKQKAEKQNGRFETYGTDLFDISQYDSDINELTAKASFSQDVQLKIQNDKILKILPPCVAALLLKETCGWRERYIIINYLIGSGYGKKQTFDVLKKFLSSEKFHHCIYEEKQLDHLWDRRDRMIAGWCAGIKREGYCPKPECGFKFYM